MSIQYLSPTEEDWEWFVPRYAQTAWKSMHAHRQKLTSFEDVQDNLERQIKRFRGPEGLDNVAFIARDENGQRAGFIWLIKSTSGFTSAAFAWIMCVYVETGFRGQGIGRHLMELGEQWAEEKGLIDIILNVSNENTFAIRLYESMRYEIETRRYIKKLAK
ncbi:MAG: GNAT family N-acetyltransferase [Anaerolineales bacterium]|jgi:ribosomal protein S18 acetylase RimI-like enzyme